MAKEYIEREAVLKYLADIRLSLAPQMWDAPEDWSLKRAEYSGLSTAIEVIELSPAADVVERNRAEWITETISGHRRNVVRRICSMCGNNNLNRKSNYCPNCGARMDGESDG